MLRVKNLPTNPDPEDKQIVADFFGLPITEVINEIQPDVFSIYIKDNEEAQKKYKEINPWGNTKVPKRFNFSERQLVLWNGKKIQPA